MIGKNDLAILNEIIYKIYNIEQFDEMRLSILNLLKLVVGYNKASFYLASNQPEHLLCKPVAVNIPQEALQNYIDEFENLDYTRWIFMSGKSMAYSETDLLSDKKREEEELYRRMYAPDGIHFSAQLSIAYHDAFLGVISLYRSKEDGNFSKTDLFALDFLKEHLAIRLHQQASGHLPGSAPPKGKTHYDMAHYINQHHLTIREVEVLGLLLGGLPNHKICEVLSISPHTLKKHSLNIYKKLNVTSRWELYNLDL